MTVPTTPKQSVSFMPSLVVPTANTLQGKFHKSLRQPSPVSDSCKAESPTMSLSISITYPKSWLVSHDFFGRVQGSQPHGNGHTKQIRDGNSSNGSFHSGILKRTAIDQETLWVDLFGELQNNKNSELQLLIQSESDLQKPVKTSRDKPKISVSRSLTQEELIITGLGDKLTDYGGFFKEKYTSEVGGRWSINWLNTIMHNVYSHVQPSSFMVLRHLAKNKLYLSI